MARYMVYLKKAMVTDVVHPKLLNVYAPPARLTTTLGELSAQFQLAFPPTTPPLETILSAVSSSPQAFSHFVPSDDHNDLYHQILIWLLKNEAVVMLHVRFRLIVTKKIKETVLEAFKKPKKQKVKLPVIEEDRGRKRISPGFGRQEPSDESTPVANRTVGFNFGNRFSEDNAEADSEGPDVLVPEDTTESFIMEPGRASPLEQLWIDEIAKQNPELERLFLR